MKTTTNRTATLIVHLLSLAIAIAGGILAIGDQIKGIPNLPPWLANAWPVFVAAATIVDRIGKIVINFFATTEQTTPET